MNNVSIRLAVAGRVDAQHLHSLEEMTLGDSDLTPSEMQAVLARPEQHVYLALSADTPVGFCATFDTASPHGPRLEVDMLGVAEPWRGHHIGARLVQTALAAAVERRIHQARAVVAVDNKASMSLFQACGFRATEEPCSLFTYIVQDRSTVDYLPDGWTLGTPAASKAGEPLDREITRYAGLHGHTLYGLKDAQNELVGAMALLSVQTVAYSGLWIETLCAESRRVVGLLARAAVKEGKARGISEIGILVPERNAGKYGHAYLAEGYRCMGTYLVWERGNNV